MLHSLRYDMDIANARFAIIFLLFHLFSFYLLWLWGRWKYICWAGWGGGNDCKLMVPSGYHFPLNAWVQLPWDLGLHVDFKVTWITTIFTLCYCYVSSMLQVAWLFRFWLNLLTVFFYPQNHLDKTIFFLESIEIIRSCMFRFPSFSFKSTTIVGIHESAFCSWWRCQDRHHGNGIFSFW